MRHWITDDTGTCQRCGGTGIFGVDEDSMCVGLAGNAGKKRLFGPPTDSDLIRELAYAVKDIDKRLMALELQVNRTDGLLFRFWKWLHTTGIVRDPNDLAQLRAASMDAAQTAMRHSQKAVEASLDAAQAAQAQVTAALVGIAKSSSDAAAEIEKKLVTSGPIEVGMGIWSVPGSNSIFHSWEEANNVIHPPDPEPEQHKKFKIIK